jgi:hypothetical protein
MASRNRKSSRFSAAEGNSRRKIGQTSAGRYLQVFYVPDEDPGSVFVITAYEPQGRRKRPFAGDRGENRNERAAKELIEHYESQTEDEEFADIEAARQAENFTLMAIPADLVPEVRALLARKQSA